jgi:hypothetical protein
VERLPQRLAQRVAVASRRLLASARVQQREQQSAERGMQSPDENCYILFSIVMSACQFKLIVSSSEGSFGFFHAIIEPGIFVQYHQRNSSFTRVICIFVQDSTIVWNCSCHSMIINQCIFLTCVSFKSSFISTLQDGGALPVLPGDIYLQLFVDVTNVGQFQGVFEFRLSQCCVDSFGGCYAVWMSVFLVFEKPQVHEQQLLNDMITPFVLHTGQLDSIRDIGQVCHDSHSVLVSCSGTTATTSS